MRPPPTCPRCDVELRPPGIWSSDWTCPDHGSVLPLQAPLPVVDRVVHHVGRRAQAPVWLPWPLPAGWLVTGVRTAGDERTGPVATAVACSGPHPAPDGDGPTAELLLVAEPPGTGLGARYAGLDTVDPGEGVTSGEPPVKLEAGGHPTPLWHVPAAPDRAVYVGEAGGVWLWAVLWPATAGVLLVEDLRLLDARDPGFDLDVPLGAMSPRLA